MAMKEKLQLLMDRLQLRPGQFARALEINPAIISHILAERNKPGVDLLQKILARFPQVSPDWLLLDTGEMFRDGSEIPTAAGEEPYVAPQPDSPASLFAENATAVTSQQTPATDPAAALSAHSVTHEAAQTQAVPVSAVAASGKTLARVVLCYTDGSCEIFSPKLH